jgi:hypothetical protein
VSLPRVPPLRPERPRRVEAEGSLFGRRAARPARCCPGGPRSGGAAEVLEDLDRTPGRIVDDGVECRGEGEGDALTTRRGVHVDQQVKLRSLVDVALSPEAHINCYGFSYTNIYKNP